MFRIWFDLAMLAAESQRVIGLRIWKLANGGTNARDEALLMVAEKVTEAAGAVASLLTGSTPTSVVRSYRATVQANERRLSRHEH